MILLEVLKIWNQDELLVDGNLVIDFGPMRTGDDDGPQYEYLSFYDEPKVYVNVSDRFYWATADLEEISDEGDLELLRKTVRDCANDLLDLDEESICMVYAGRRRNLQVMPRYMKGIVGELLKDLPENDKWEWIRTN